MFWEKPHNYVGANWVAVTMEKIRKSNRGSEEILAMAVMEFVWFTQKNHRHEPMNHTCSPIDFKCNQLKCAL